MKCLKFWIIYLEKGIKYVLFGFTIAKNIPFNNRKEKR